MGLFVGGAPLEIDYSLALTSNAYKSASQLRNIKVCTTNENYLHKRKDETTSLKFDGKLDTSSPTTSQTELDKKQFIHALRDLVQRFGLQTFFYMPNSNLTGMISVVTDSHLVTLEAVIKEYKDRLTEPPPVYSRAVDGSITTIELASSTSARFRSYDEYERNDIALSRLAVECLISETLRGEVETRFEHDPLFHEYAGQVYYMMILEVVNASTTHDIDAASKAFDALSLASFPGENINKFSTEALRLIHIMRGAYALPYQLGSKLLSKVDNTQSTYFNQQVHDLKKVARSMEIAHGCLRDPKLLESASDYKTHGPIPLCSSLQREYGELKKTNEWPALSSTLPEGNYTPGPRRCFRCNSPNHLLPDCPVPSEDTPATDNTPSAGARSGRNGGTGSRTGNGSNPPPSSGAPSPGASGASVPGAVWKYIKPANLDQEIMMNGHSYFYCAKCRCTRTNKTGFYNRTHPTSQHVAGAGLGAASRAADVSNPAAPGSTPSAPNSSDANLSPVDDDNDSADSASVDADPDGFTFHGGAYCSEVNDSAWMASISTSSDEDLVPTAEAPKLSPVALCNLSTLASPSSSLTATSAAASNLEEISVEGIKLLPPAAIPTVLDVPQTTHEATAWIKSSPHTPSDNGMVRATLALEAYSLPRQSSWPRNVISSLPGYTLFDDKSIEVGILPGPCHCTICGKLGDYKSNCVSCHGTHLYHDDSDYEQPYLSDSDEDKSKTTSSYFYLPTSEQFYFDCYTSLPDEIFYDCQSNAFRPATTVPKSSSAPSRVPSSTTFAPSSVLSSPFLPCLLTGLSHLLLLLSTLVWDTIYLFQDPSSPIQPYLHRRTRRALSRRRSQPLRAFPSRWMLLSYFALSPTFLQLPFPSLGFAKAFSDTSGRVAHLHQLVEFSPGVHLQFHGIRLRELQSFLAPDSSATTDTTTSYSQNDVHFFDSFQSISEMEGDDFFDALEEPHFLESTFDWLDLPSLTDPHRHIWADHQYSSDDLSNPTVSAQANSALLPPTLGNVDLYPAGTLPSSFPVIFDSGASLAISPSSHDFVGPIIPLPDDRRLGGMAGGMPIAGIGKIAWTFQTPKGNLTVHSKCYHVPNAGARLLSPQRLFSAAHGVSGSFNCAENSATLTFDGVGSINVPYDSNNHLPISLAKNLTGVQANLTILDESNQNLTPSQKLLLLWHVKFGHKSFATIQRLLRQSPFGAESFKGASRCSIPRCEVCEHAKAHRRSTKGSIQRVNPDTDGSIRSNCLTAGASVSVDHFESRLKGRTLTSYGRDSSDKYVGGCIFVDHMSGYIHVEPQLGFSGSETIRAKQNYERMALNHGLLIESYLCDNGIFKGKAFVRHLQEHNQKVHYCGVNAHHKNAVAERSIRTVSECARALLLHSALRWKNGPITSDLWPFAVEHACYLYNRCPDSSNSCPADRFLGSVLPRHKFKDLHTWGCPVYVLDPKLQQGRKLPRWEPRARRGVFLGYSSVHSSDVPLILNLTTGSISPQYHVVFDDTFSTVVSLSAEEEPPPFWNEVDLDEYVSRVHLDEDTPATLSEEWLTPSELEERRRSSTRSQQIRQSFTTTPASLEESTANLEEPTIPNSTPSDTPTSRTKSVRFSDTPTVTTPTTLPTDTSNSLPAPSTLPSSTPNSESGVSSTSSPRRSTRSTKGTFQSTKYVPVFLSSILDPTRTHHESELAYLADLSTDFDTEEYHCTDPRAYAAKHKINDPDMPTYTNALSGPHAEEYMAAMKKEVKQLIKQKTWTAMHRKNVPTTSKGQSRPILKGTWAFKLKRLPDGSPSKFKARYCVRGDLQREGIDYFETYAPVVQWSTVRLLLTLILSNNWTTKQVDYTNAFAQATLNEEVYIESPRGFSRGDGKGVLKLNNSLYGLKQAPKTFFDKLRDGLIERGFTQSILDPCLFMKKDMICVIYVDDTIFAGPDSVAIDKLIKSLGIKKEDQVHSFELRDEGEVGDFLGIRIERGSHGNFELTQTGLIEKVLKESKMLDSKSTVKTPASTTPLGIDKDGDPFNESWEYPVVVGMLMFLAQNTRPDIAYAVHQCARFTHNPKDSHAIAIKRILRYLNGTRTGGMTLQPTGDLQVDCYVDADFAGLWNVEDDQNPLCVKSRSGYLITFMNCPLLWTSKLQTQIALSTMESEYIALSQSMRELIGVREVLKEIYLIVLKDSASFNKVKYTTHAKTFGCLPSSIVHEDNESCLRFATVPKMSPRTKHIALPYHFFRSKVANKEIIVKGIDTNNQLADQFTKGLPQDKFLRDRKILLGW